MGKEIQKLDGMQFTDAYHSCMKTVEAFNEISANIPKTFLEVKQHIYGRFDETLYNILIASNTFDVKKKLFCLEIAQNNLFFTFSSLEILCNSRAITVGAANTVIKPLKDAHQQVVKWYKATLKVAGQKDA